MSHFPVIPQSTDTCFNTYAVYKIAHPTFSFVMKRWYYNRIDKVLHMDNEFEILFKDLNFIDDQMKRQGFVPILPSPEDDVSITLTYV